MSFNTGLLVLLQKITSSPTSGFNELMWSLLSFHEIPFTLLIAFNCLNFFLREEVWCNFGYFDFFSVIFDYFLRNLPVLIIVPFLYSFMAYRCSQLFFVSESFLGRIETCVLLIGKSDLLEIPVLLFIKEHPSFC